MFAVTGTAFSAAKRLTNDGKVRRGHCELGRNAKLIGPSLSSTLVVDCAVTLCSLCVTLWIGGTTT